MTKAELIEALAEKEHASWARWMQYLFSRCVAVDDGHENVQYIIPPDLVKRWMRQMETPYDHLSEQEKQSDRDEVAHILPIIDEYARPTTDEITRRLETLEEHFTDAGINELARAIEQWLVSRMRYGRDLQI